MLASRHRGSFAAFAIVCSVVIGAICTMIAAAIERMPDRLDDRSADVVRELAASIGVDLAEDEVISRCEAGAPPGRGAVFELPPDLASLDLTVDIVHTSPDIFYALPADVPAIPAVEMTEDGESFTRHTYFLRSTSTYGGRIATTCESLIRVDVETAFGTYVVRDARRIYLKRRSSPIDDSLR